jgi:hypothetical protein
MALLQKRHDHAETIVAYSYQFQFGSRDVPCCVEKLDVGIDSHQAITMVSSMPAFCGKADERPCLNALRLDLRRPSLDLGPQLRFELARLAAICFSVAIISHKHARRTRPLFVARSDFTDIFVLRQGLDHPSALTTQQVPNQPN